MNITTTALSRRNNWRNWLVQKISITLLLKLAALIALWWLFFSSAHRVEVDKPQLERKLALPIQGETHHDGYNSR